MDYVVIGTEMGHRCGYVSIPNGHYLYGKEQSEPLIGLNIGSVMEEKIGDRGVIPILLHSMSETPNEEDSIPMNVLFNVHGSITYSNEFAELGPGWWIGFDCRHHNDLPDPSLMSEEYSFLNVLNHNRGTETIKTTAYVETQCKNLITQIKKYCFGRNKKDE